jgi:predicted metal-dependent hydrolase
MAGTMRLSLFRKAPEPDHVLVPHGPDVFRVDLRRSSTARRMTLRVATATGGITLSLPPRADIAAAERFALSHGGWIAARLAKRPVAVRFLPGSLIPFRGIPHRIVHWSSIRSATRALTDKDGAPIIAVAGDIAHVPRRVADFLKAEARRDIEAAVQRHTQALGLPARRITLRDTTSRWGSCSARGDLSFSWRLVLAPPLVLDYLAAHEVAHLKEMNHSARFWAITHQLFPRTEEAEKWLKKNGAGLHVFG